MKRYVGVDLPKNNFHACYASRSGLKQQLYELNPSGIRKFKVSLSKADEVGIEATGKARYLAGEIEKALKKVVNHNSLAV